MFPPFSLEDALSEGCLDLFLSDLGRFGFSSAEVDHELEGGDYGGERMGLVSVAMLMSRI